MLLVWTVSWGEKGRKGRVFKKEYYCNCYKGNQ